MEQTDSDFGQFRADEVAAWQAVQWLPEGPILGLLFGAIIDPRDRNSKSPVPKPVAGQEYGPIVLADDTLATLHAFGNVASRVKNAELRAALMQHRREFEGLAPRLRVWRAPLPSTEQEQLVYDFRAACSRGRIETTEGTGRDTGETVYRCAHVWAWAQEEGYELPHFLEQAPSNGASLSTSANKPHCNTRLAAFMRSHLEAHRGTRFRAAEIAKAAEDGGVPMPRDYSERNTAVSHAARYLRHEGLPIPKGMYMLPSE